MPGSAGWGVRGGALDSEDDLSLSLGYNSLPLSYSRLLGWQRRSLATNSGWF